jgi:DNA-binding beta-propeller fold protein YncE
MHRSNSVATLTFCLALASPAAFGQVPTSAYVNFEGSQTNPIRLSADGTRLYAANTADARLSVFDVSNASTPKLIAEIPVGIEPVSVNPRTKDEVWVVNQESDSISVVSVSKGIVTNTIYVKDEPMDVVFAGSNLAFVSVSRSNEIAVVDVNTYAVKTLIPVFGNNPRALAVSPDGKRVYAAFAFSGNHTTIIPAAVAPAQTIPPGTTAPLPPPQVGLIADARDPNWSNVIKYTMPDNDVVAIDTNSLTIAGYFTGVGTINLGIAVRPATGEIYVTNTDALNLTHYEPFLRGHFINNRVTKISGATITAFDLNPGIDYKVLPNPSALATALSQPTAILFHPNSQQMYVASFGTDRVAVLDPNGSVLSRIELEPTAVGSNVDPANKRGPRGLALNAASSILYVSNRISNTISVINNNGVVTSEIPVGSFDPTPTVIRAGRGFLYDAKLSGNGTGSCASCHVDGDMDHLAWDLGNPFGSVETITQRGDTINFHPMKGPMTTQTLRGLVNIFPYHWRGDRADFTAFNPAFDSLMGGSQISAADMTAYTNFINTVTFQPNPFQNIDRSFPTSLLGGNAAKGRSTYINAVLMQPETATCNTCHTANPGPGTNRFIQGIAPNTVNDDQNLKVPELRNIYQKLLFDNSGGPTIDGFGLDHEGDVSNLAAFFSAGSFARYSTTQKSDIGAFLLSFDTGTAPSVGYARTVTPSNVGGSLLQLDWTGLQVQALEGNVDLIAKGTINGQVHGLLYQPASQSYKTDTTGLGPYTRAQLITLIRNGDTLTFMGVPPGSGVRMGIDRNLDGILDGDAP